MTLRGVNSSLMVHLLAKEGRSPCRKFYSCLLVLAPNVSFMGEGDHQSLTEVKECSFVEVQTAELFPRKGREAPMKVEFEFLRDGLHWVGK